MIWWWIFIEEVCRAEGKATSITVTTAETHRVMRCQGSDVFYINGSQMPVRVPASCIDQQPLISEKFLVLISVRGFIQPHSHSATG
jgi:hypothetical protein